MLRIKQIIVVLLLCGASSTFAQTGSNSPYSIAGLGEQKFRGLMQHKAMGGVSRSITDIYSFSPVNPASYANVKYTVYAAGLNLSVGQLETTTDQAFTRNGNIGYFAMAFGIPRESERRMGVSFGFHERSSVGYEVENTHLLDTPGYYDLFRGKGGLSSVYLGYGVELFNDFLLGANLNYTFGSVSALQAKIFPYTADLLSFSDEFLYYYRGINVDLGVHYTVQDSLFHKWKLSHSFAATLSSKTNLKGKGFQYAETFFGIPYYNDQRIITVDTVKYEENLQTSARIPVCFGFAYTLSNAKSWGLSLEFETSKWSTITSSLNGQAFYDNKRYSIGFYWVPELDFSVKEDFWKKTEYRAGLRYEQLYYNFFGQQINEIGISFGLGLPITKSITLIDDRVNLLNHVDIGFEYMTRGTTDHDLIEEQYFILNIGLNFNDKWFIKRKYL